MKNIINVLKTDKVTLWGFSISLGFIILSLLITGLSFRFLPPFVPLYNGMPWGYARLANRVLFFLPVSVTTVFFIANVFFSGLIYKQAALLSRMLCATTILLAVIAGLFSIQIILLIH